MARNKRFSFRDAWKYWSFRRRGFVFLNKNDPNPTVRRHIFSRICNLTNRRLFLPSGLRRQFQVDVSFFCFFWHAGAPSDAPPPFFEPAGRALAVSELSACYLRAGSLCAPREASVLVSSAPSDPGEKAPQISSPRVNAVDRAENTR